MNTYRYITICFLISFISSSLHLQASEKDISQNITLRVENTTLREALTAISSQIEIYFMYDDELVKDKTISCHCSKVSLEECLDQLLIPHHIQYKIVNDYSCILYKDEFRTIRGFIYDKMTKEPLLNANIYIKGAGSGTVSDSKGEFRLKIPVDTEILTIRYMGYETYQVYLLEAVDGMKIPMNPIVIPMQPVEKVGKTINTDLPEIAIHMGNEQSFGIGLMSNQIQSPVKQLPEIRTLHLTVIENKKKTIVEVSAIQISKVRKSSVLNITNRIRQGQSRDDLTIVDGIRFYEPYHINIVPGINTCMYSNEMIGMADYYFGGYDAIYGDALNSLLHIQYQNNTERWLSGKILSGIPGHEAYLSVGKPNKYTCMFHARSNQDKYLPKTVQTDRKVSPAFYDFQAKINYKVSNVNEIELFYLHSKDRCQAMPYDRTYKEWELWTIQPDETKPREEMLSLNTISEEGEDLSEYKTHIMSLKSNSNFDDWSTNMRFSHFRGHLSEEFYSHSNISSALENPSYISSMDVEKQYSNNISENIYEGNINFISKPSLKQWISTGITCQNIQFEKDEVMNDPYTWKTNIIWPSPGTRPYQGSLTDSIQAKLNTFKVTYYLKTKIRNSNRMAWDIGARIDYFHFNKKLSFNPRISFYKFLTNKILFRLAAGMYSQSPVIEQTNSFINTETNIGNQLAIHYLTSLDIELHPGSNLQMELFYKQFRNLIPIKRLSDGGLACVPEENVLEGFSRGMHISYTGQYHPFNTSISYTLMEAKETPYSEFAFPDFYHRYNDQRHTLYARLSIEMLKNTKIHLNHYYGSGFAFTPQYIAPVRDKNRWEVEQYNSSHFPAYNRIDIGVQQNFKVPGGSIELQIRLVNILNRKNVFAYSYSYDDNAYPVRMPQVMYGFLPLISLSYIF